MRAHAPADDAYGPRPKHDLERVLVTAVGTSVALVAGTVALMYPLLAAIVAGTATLPLASVHR